MRETRNVWRGVTIVSILFVLLTASTAAFPSDFDAQMDQMKAEMKADMDAKFDSFDTTDSSSDDTTDTTNSRTTVTVDAWNDDTVNQDIQEMKNDIQQTFDSWDDTSDSTDDSSDSTSDNQDTTDTWFDGGNDGSSDDGSSDSDDSSSDDSVNTGWDYWDDNSGSSDDSQDDTSDDSDSTSGSDGFNDGSSDDSSSDSGSVSGSLEERTEQHLHQNINDERRQRGLSPLNFDSTLRQTADAKSQDMAQNDYFSHTAPDGTDFMDIYRRYGYSCSAGGENIARTWFDRSVRTDTGSTVHYDTAEELADGLTRQWMTSAGHRRAILRSYYNNHGLGVEITDSGEVYATEHFC